MRIFTFSKGCLAVKPWSGVMVRIRVDLTAEGYIVSLKALTSMEAQTRFGPHNVISDQHCISADVSCYVIS